MILWVPLLFLKKKPIMINEKPKLENINPVVIAAVDAIHYGIGRSYDITILVGQVDDETWPIWSLQGRDTKGLNEVRKKMGLFTLAENESISVVQESWKETLCDGESVVLLFNKFAYRYKENKEIKGMFQWLNQTYPNIIVEKCENPKYDTFLISGTFTEGMKIPSPSPMVEEPSILFEDPES